MIVPKTPYRVYVVEVWLIGNEGEPGWKKPMYSAQHSLCNGKGLVKNTLHGRQHSCCLSISAWRCTMRTWQRYIRHEFFCQVNAVWKLYRCLSHRLVGWTRNTNWMNDSCMKYQTAACFLVCCIVSVSHYNYSYSIKLLTPVAHFRSEIIVPPHF